MNRPTISKVAYRIETERLVIRCWNPSDAILLQQATAVSRDHLLPFMPWAHDEPQTVDQKVELLRKFRAAFDRHEDYSYAIFNADESRLLGSIYYYTRPLGNAFEIGYWMHKDFINQGYITESTAALTKIGFEVYALDRLEIFCAFENPGSAAIPRKLGYIHEATRRRMTYYQGGIADCMVWTLLREEYPNTPSAASDVRAYDPIGNSLLQATDLS